MKSVFVSYFFLISLSFAIRSYTWMQAMKYAIDDINKDGALLPNISLGFQTVDSCLDISRTLWATLWIISGVDSAILNYQCQPGMPIAIIGDALSSSSMAMAALLGLYKYPQVRHFLKDVHFDNKMGEDIYYDPNGDPPADYSIINWHRREDGSIEFVNVGRYNMRESAGAQLTINVSGIQWITGRGEIPRSVCSESCPPGFRKAARKDQPVCCFDCIPCSEGEISTQTDMSNCFPCSAETWPNKNNTICIPKIIEYLSYWEPIGIILTFAVISFCFATLSTLSIFLKHKDTAIVKANNRDITYLLLGSLSINFLGPLLFIGEPRKFTCLFRQGAFGVIFVLSVSSVLAKTIMVVIAFRATKPGNNMRRFVGPQVPALTISFCVFIQLLICISWILTCPPFPERNIRIKTGIIVFQCNECSDTLLWCMLGYMAFLACVSFLVAFLARKLPDNFNEAKWITFSMLIFLSVWISFVPAYLSTQGKYMVSVEIFGILSSSAGILVCIFLPKSYLILFRPELNTRGHLLGKGSAHKSSL